MPFNSLKLPKYDSLCAALKTIVSESNGGFGLNMWAVVVDRDGVVKAVTFSGGHRAEQWPGSRVIAAQKANTANAFGLKGLALSTANLYSAIQPGGSLYGLSDSNPVDTKVAYAGDSTLFGQSNDPMTGLKIGGINTFGGGLGLYSADGELIGAIGVSGDSSGADHNIAWKLRHLLDLDYVSTGVSPTGDDNIIYDLQDGVSASGWGHPACSEEATAIAVELPKTHPTR